MVNLSQSARRQSPVREQRRGALQTDQEVGTGATRGRTFFFLPQKRHCIRRFLKSTSGIMGRGNLKFSPHRSHISNNGRREVGVFGWPGLRPPRRGDRPSEPRTPEVPNRRPRAFPRPRYGPSPTPEPGPGRRAERGRSRARPAQPSQTAGPSAGRAPASPPAHARTLTERHCPGCP